LLAVVLIGSFTFALLPSQIAERVGTIRTASATDQSAQMRFDSWWVSLQIIGDHPLLGVGPRNMLGLYSRYLQTENVRVAHNSFLQMAVDAGLPALLLFLGVIVLSYLRLRRTRQILKTRAPDSQLIAYSHGLEIALLAYFVSGNFLSRHDLELVYEVFALATSLSVLARDLERQAEARETVESEPRTFLPEPAVASASLNNPV
jgi:O-antigen ligase